MGSLLEGQHALLTKLLIGLFLGTSTLTFAGEQDKSEVAKPLHRAPLHRESHMVAVEWQSTPSLQTASSEQDEAVRHAVTKPLVDGFAEDESVEHTVYQSPSVYLDSPRNQPVTNPILEGFKQAGQASNQALNDIGNGINNVALPNNSQQNQNQPNQIALPPPPVNRQTGAYDPDYADSGFTTTQAANNQYSEQQQNNARGNNQQPNQQNAQQQNNQQRNDIPAVPRQPYDTGISTNFGTNNNSNGNPNYRGDDSQLAPVQVPRQDPYANNNNYNGGSYQNQNPYQNNQAPANQNQNQNQNRSNMITPPGINEYAGGSSSPSYRTPQWSSPPLNQVSGPVNQQTSRPVTSPDVSWPAPNNTTNETASWNNNPAAVPPVNQTSTPPVTQAGVLGGGTEKTRSNYELVWILAGFSLFGNVYGWTALLDMRNKYRASLRRNPVNLRDGGH